MPDAEQWMNKAALYEFLAASFAFVSEETVAALATGEYAEALVEIGSLNGMEKSFLEAQASDLKAYPGRDEEEVLHCLRKEHTRLFIGGSEPLVTPYAGVWDARANDRPALLMINAESMAIERFMRRCGIGQPEGTNEPLDHIASLLEFLYYFCLVKADAVQPPSHADIRNEDYELFFDDHVAAFSQAFATSVVQESREPFFVSAAQVLLQLKR